MRFNEVLYWQKIEKTDGCWNWTAGTNGEGYGSLRAQVDGRWTHVLAHRAMWWLVHGEIPEVIDHLCKNRRCVRPDHLDNVTNAINLFRARLEKCRQGHNAWYEEKSGRRRCRTCVDELEIKRGRRVAQPRRTA